jgi:isoleucyl-tRNA synthetase
LGSSYLDIIKDRQYTAKTDGLARRSAQTAMFHVLEALTRWLAPILSYTAEEIWQHLPAVHERPESVFLTTWYEDLTPLDSTTEFNHDFWQTVMDVRAEVSQALEHSRATKEIGSSLAANVELECDAKTFETLAKLGDELRFVFITSGAKITKSDSVDYQVKIKVTASSEQKCVRCWHQRSDVGSHAEHPELCGRCVENIAGEGEKRLYA